MFRRFFEIPPYLEVPSEIKRVFRRNFLANGGDMTFWLMGMSFVSIQAILPVYAARLTESPFIIGLIPALTDALWFLPQLFLAPYVERLERKQPAVVVLGLIERVPYFLLPLMVLWMDRLARPAAVAVFVFWLFWKSLGSGIVAIPWQEMVAKVTPMSHRGRLFGLAHVCGLLLGVGGSAIAAWLLGALAYPYNYAASFAVAAGWVGLSQAMLMQVREPAMPAAAARQPTWAEYSQRLRIILAKDANFRVFLFSRWLAVLGGMATGFLAVYAIERFDMPDSTAAVFTGVLYATGVVGYGVFGFIGDHSGHKPIMVAGGLLGLAALGMALAAPAAWGFYVVFGLVGLANAATVLSDMSLTMELGPEAERPTYIGLARTIVGPSLLIAPLLGGWIAQTWSYALLFSLSIAFGLAGLAVLILFVRDPRQQHR